MASCTTGASKHHGWLDRVAMGMAALCAVHCLLTPLLVVLLPIVATSFFVHEDFHLWMLLLVLPTTGLAIFMGCRRHKDKWVATLSAIGLSVLIGALIHERMHHAANVPLADEVSHCESCASCSRDIAEEPIPMHAGAWINTFGGLMLASAHFRNFRLCRRNKCSHD